MLDRVTGPRWIVALPARNEAARIEGAVAALDRAAAKAAWPVRLLVLANGCSDGTHDIAAAAIRAARHLDGEVHSRTLPAALSHAGGARREAVATARDAFGRSRGFPNRPDQTQKAARRAGVLPTARLASAQAA